MATLHWRHKFMSLGVNKLPPPHDISYINISAAADSAMSAEELLPLTQLLPLTGGG